MPVVAVFGFHVILDGVAVKPFRQRDVDLKMAKQYEAQFFIRRAAHGVMQTRFRQGYSLYQRVAIGVPLLLMLAVTIGDVVRLFT